MNLFNTNSARRRENRSLLLAAIMALTTSTVTFCCCLCDAPRKPAKIKGNYSYAKETLTQAIKQAMAKYNIKGMSIALVADQDVIWEEGFGYADVEGKIPASKDTVYRIGSISKLFTGIAVMQLHEQGKININKPLETYIPKFSVKTHFDPSKYPAITPRNLLTHHSGLLCDLKKGISTRLDQEPTDLSLLDYVDLLQHEYTSTPANLIYAYSNVGFSVLGALIEAIIKQNFAVYTDKNIFQKMNMLKTSFGLPNVSKSALAKAYAGDEEFKEAYYYHGYPDGSVRSSVSDMAQFLKTIFANDGTILKPETLQLMLTPQDKTSLDLDDNAAMGLAFKLNLKPLTVCLHGGIVYPFNGLLVFLPEYKIGVIFLCNSLPPVTQMSQLLQASDDIENAIVKKALEITFEVKTGKQLPPFQHKQYTAAPITTLSTNTLRKHVGFYTYGVDHNLAEITLTNGYLYINIENNSHCLIPHEDGTFSLRDYWLGFIPVTPTGYDDTFFSFKTISGYDVIVKNKETLWGAKIHLKPVPNAWKNRIGAYKITNATEADEQEKYALVIENDILFLQEGDSKTFAAPISDTLAVVPTGHVFTLGGTTLQAIEEKEGQLLLFSGLKLKKIE